ncbi:hypothetical protein [Changchengzhania lutea]|uniref:hypothetical protein n=1 Tax=Changchengzhania lutea TaxID=2049305 RepID=UPI00115E0CD7|nr:hypothetical protein [Changchengzhania lutea]
MKSILILMSVVTLAITQPKDVSVDTDKTSTITAVFDAYEGEIFFFTNTENNEPLTLYVTDTSVVKDFRLIEGESIGETFELTILEEKDKALIKSLSKL